MMGTCVISTLKQGLGAKFTSDAEAAYAKLFAYVQGQMQKGGAHD